jgi:hypothetical protein
MDKKVTIMRSGVLTVVLVNENCSLLGYDCVHAVLSHRSMIRVRRYNKTGRASVLYNFILVFLIVFCGLNTLFKIPVIFK